MSRSCLPSLALVALGLLLAWLVHDAPLAPDLARGWLRADALSALALILLGAHGLAACGLGRPGAPRDLAAAWLFGLAAITGHLAVVAGLLALGGWASAAGAGRPRAPLVATLMAAAGLLLIGGRAGEWRYGAPAAGAGLNSLSFALILAATLAAAGAYDIARGRAPAAEPLVAVACLYALLRLYSLGPWNLGWLFAALVAGGSAALWAAGRAAAAPPEDRAAWLGLYLAGLALAGAGLGSGAGVILSGYGMLTWPVVRLGLSRPAGPRRPLWLLAGAVPLTAPFMVAWMGVAAAVAGGLTVLAAAIWAAALLAAVAVVRLATGQRPPSDPATPPAATWGGRAPSGLAGLLSAALGLGAPLAVIGLLGPVVDQLQGGLTPFGEIVLWPWAGLIAYDAARQPVATMPSVALGALMLILSALCWVALRLAAGRGR